MLLAYVLLWSPPPYLYLLFRKTNFEAAYDLSSTPVCHITLFPTRYERNFTISIFGSDAVHTPLKFRIGTTITANKYSTCNNEPTITSTNCQKNVNDKSNVTDYVPTDICCKPGVYFSTCFLNFKSVSNVYEKNINFKKVFYIFNNFP